LGELFTAIIVCEVVVSLTFTCGAFDDVATISFINSSSTSGKSPSMGAISKSVDLRGDVNSPEIALLLGMLFFAETESVEPKHFIDLAVFDLLVSLETLGSALLTTGLSGETFSSLSLSFCSKRGKFLITGILAWLLMCITGLVTRFRTCFGESFLASTGSWETTSRKFSIAPGIGDIISSGCLAATSKKFSTGSGMGDIILMVLIVNGFFFFFIDFRRNSGPISPKFLLLIGLN